ncbi:hypothetical protein [Haliangium ochraceum]|nr:hypothetical protein [Haliangium ochraceum]
MTCVVAGCGNFIEPDDPEISVAISPREFTVATEQWELTSPSGTVFPELSCDASERQVCEAELGELCGSGNCESACVDNACELSIAVSLWRTVDLYEDNPRLRALGDAPLLEVDIGRVYFGVVENTLNFDMPPLTLSVAPADVMDAADLEAHAIATLPALSMPGPATEAALLLDEGQRAALAEQVRAYRTPFNLIVSTRVRLAANEPLPSGTLSAYIGVEATARQQ